MCRNMFGFGTEATPTPLLPPPCSWLRTAVLIIDRRLCSMYSECPHTNRRYLPRPISRQAAVFDLDSNMPPSPMSVYRTSAPTYSSGLSSSAGLHTPLSLPIGAAPHAHIRAAVWKVHHARVLYRLRARQRLRELSAMRRSALHHSPLKARTARRKTNSSMRRPLPRLDGPS